MRICIKVQYYILPHALSHSLSRSTHTHTHTCPWPWKCCTLTQWLLPRSRVCVSGELICFHLCLDKYSHLFIMSGMYSILCGMHFWWVNIAFVPRQRAVALSSYTEGIWSRLDTKSDIIPNVAKSKGIDDQSLAEPLRAKFSSVGSGLLGQVTMLVCHPLRYRLKYPNYWMDCCTIVYRHAWWFLLTTFRDPLTFFFGNIRRWTFPLSK